MDAEREKEIETSGSPYSEVGGSPNYQEFDQIEELNEREAPRSLAYYGRPFDSDEEDQHSDDDASQTDSAPSSGRGGGYGCCADTSSSLYAEPDDLAEKTSSSGQPVAYASSDDSLKDEEEIEDEEGASSSSDDEGERETGAQAKSWNERFQLLLQQNNSAEKYSKLSKLAHDFVFAADTYGRIIISEIGLPAERKTIKPISIGGQAGGEKYIVQGIFFKFALDIFDIYGGDAYAMKAASHDLKGLIHYYSSEIEGLHVPLMALIDYMGFRLIAISVLPIGGDTLLYGSADGGETIHKDNRDLNKKMKLAAKKMNLKGHSVGLKEYDVKKLYAPVDIEGHLGRDGRFYVLDYARTFPPEKPSLERRTRKGIILYNLLRPELVRQNPVPLSPDAFTVWSRIDPNKVEHNREVLEATERLLNQVIPALAKQLNRLTHHNNEEDEEGENNETSRQYQERRPSWDEKEEDIVRRIDVIEQAHMTGVNVRHLGRLRRLVQSKLLQQKILIEMIARVVRKQSQALLRDAIRHSGVPSEGPARQAMASLFNMVLGKGDAGSSENKTTYWTKKLKEQLLYQYEQALFDIEMEEGYDLREGLDMLDLIERIAQLTSIRFTEQARRDMEKTIRSGQNFKFVFCDFEGLSSHVKHMNLIDVADGTSMFYDSLKEKGSNQVRMLTMALTKFQEASRKMPFNPDIITNLGDLLVQHAEQQVLRGEMDAAEQSFENALMAFKTALSIRPGYSRCVVGMGNIYLAQQKIEEAIFRYEEALALEPEGSAEAHLQLGRIAYKLGHNIDYEKASHHFQKAAELNADLHIAALLAANSQFLSLLQNVEKDDFVLVTNSTPASSTIEQEVYEIAAKYEKSLALSDSASESLVGSAVKKSNLYLLLLFHVATYSDRLKEVLKRELASITTLSFETMLSGGDEAIRLGRSTYLCEHLLELLPLCSSLRELALPTCGTLTDLHVAQIVTIFASSGLETLNVRNCTQLTDESLQKIASEAGWSKHLQCLYFDGCTNLSSSALEDTITKSCPNLRSISLQNVSSVQDSLVQSLLNYCTQLEELDFRNCSALTQNAFISASSAASSSGEGAENTNAECNTSSYSVKILRLEGQSGFTHETLIAILDKMPALEELGLRNVQTLDDATLLPMMSRRCPSLKLLVAPSGTPFTYSGKDGLQVQMREMTQTAYFIDLKTSKNILQVSHRSFFRTVDGTDIRINHPRPGFITLTDGNSATLASFTKEQFSGQWVCKLLDGSISRFRFDSLTKRLTFTPNEAISIQSLLAGYHRIVIKPGMNATLALLTTYVALEAK